MRGQDGNTEYDIILMEFFLKWTFGTFQNEKMDNRFFYKIFYSKLFLHKLYVFKKIYSKIFF